MRNLSCFETRFRAGHSFTLCLNSLSQPNEGEKIYEGKIQRHSQPQRCITRAALTGSGTVAYWLSAQTCNTGVASLNPARVSIKTQLARKTTGSHLMPINSLEKAQSSVWFLLRLKSSKRRRLDRWRLTSRGLKIRERLTLGRLYQRRLN